MYLTALIEHDDCKISTSENAIICSEPRELYLATLFGFILLSVVSCLLLPHFRLQKSFGAPPPPFLGAILASTLGAERVFQRHCLTALYTIGEWTVEKLDHASAA